MAGRLLLDTSVVIDLFTGDGAVQQGLADAEEIFLPSIAVGELLYGARVSVRAEANVAHVEALDGACCHAPGESGAPALCA